MRTSQMPEPGQEVVYIIHAECDGPHHYIGTTKDFLARIRAHRETMWTPLPTPVHTTNGGIKRGETNGKGATFLAFLNYQGVAWKVVWWGPGGRQEEIRLKRRKKTSQLCPVCRGEIAFNDVEEV